MDEVRLQPIRNSDLRTVHPEDDDSTLEGYSRDSRAATNLASASGLGRPKEGISQLTVVLYSTSCSYGLYRVSPATGEDDVWFDRI